MNANIVGDLVSVFDQIDAMRGITHKLEFPAPACKNCNGWGHFKPNSSPDLQRTCMACSGTGWAAVGTLKC